jgi:hypothetical protein
MTGLFVPASAATAPVVSEPRGGCATPPGTPPAPPPPAAPPRRPSPHPPGAAAAVPSPRMPRRPCLVPGCPNLAAPGKPRCPDHHAARSRAVSRARGSATARGYDSKWAAYAKARIAAWRERHGDICPGWDRDPHPVDNPRSWVCDHDAGQAMCRSCNSRKAATHDKARAAERRAAWRPPQP